MRPDFVDAALHDQLDAEFQELRGALLRHCYHMTGSFHDAEDLVQETYMRARRGLGRFEQRSSLKTWLYRIATNRCLTALQATHRRVLPSGLGAPADDPDAPPGIDLGLDWLQPLPDDLVRPQSPHDPAQVVVLREAVQLALVAAIQYLPPRQRAVFLLRAVLDWPAEEVGQVLEISVPAVKSLLQRARRRIDQADFTMDSVDQTGVEDHLLARYIEAFETSDHDIIRRLVHDDFSLEITPAKTWYQGVATCIPFLQRHALASPGDWRMLPTRVNGQPAAISYLRDDNGRYSASGFCVLTVGEGKIRRANVFKDPSLVTAARYPMYLPG